MDAVKICQACGKGNMAQQTECYFCHWKKFSKTYYAEALKPEAVKSNSTDWLCLFALYDNKGTMVKCTNELNETTNFFPPDTYSTEMWNELFLAKDRDRADIFEKFGWSVKAGKFIQA